MSVEDLVKMALLRQGRIKSLDDETVLDTSDPNTATDNISLTVSDNDYNDPGQESDEETRLVIAEILTEFVRRDKVSFTQLAAVRRVFQRVLMHLCTQTQPCTVSNIKNTIDPRYRNKVPLLLEELTKAGILQCFNDDTMKPRWLISHNYKAQAIVFASER